MNETTNLVEGRYRVGLVGAGRQGTFFGRAFATNPATEVVAACNRSQDTLDLFCQRFGVAGHRTSSRAGGLNCEPLKAVCVEQIMRPLKGDDYSPSCS